MLDICRCALVPYVQRAQGAPALYLARPQDASDVLPVLHRAGTLRCRPDQPGGVDAHEVVLPRHLQILLRPAATLLCRHRQAVEPLEISQLGRTYVSLTFQRRFGSFASHVNGLRQNHYEQYIADHPNETKEAAAIVAGFSSYNAYYRAVRK